MQTDIEAVRLFDQARKSLTQVGANSVTYRPIERLDTFACCASSTAFHETHRGQSPNGVLPDARKVHHRNQTDSG